VVLVAGRVDLASSPTPLCSRASLDSDSVPLSLSDDQLDQVMRHAAVVHPGLRRAFVDHVAHELRGRSIGDGAVRQGAEGIRNVLAARSQRSPWREQVPQSAAAQNSGQAPAALACCQAARNLALASSSVAAWPFVMLGTAGTISVIDQNHRNSGGVPTPPCS
jgi:hypothetical protein